MDPVEGCDCVRSCEWMDVRYETAKARQLTSNIVQYEKASHDVTLRLSSNAALLQAKLFLVTKVLPTRQKIAGFKGFASGFPPVRSKRRLGLRGFVVPLL